VKLTGKLNEFDEKGVIKKFKTSLLGQILWSTPWNQNMLDVKMNLIIRTEIVRKKTELFLLFDFT